MPHGTILPVLSSTSRDSSRKLGATGIDCAWQVLPAMHRAYHPTLTPTDGSWLNLIERWFELLRNIRIGGAHAGDKVERALKGFTEATDDTLLATNPKRLSGRNPRTRFWPTCPALPALQSKFTALHLCKTTMTHHSRALLITPRLPRFVVCEYRFTLRAASQEEYIGIQDKPY